MGDFLCKPNDSARVISPKKTIGCEVGWGISWGFLRIRRR